MASASNVIAAYEIIGLAQNQVPESDAAAFAHHVAAKKFGTVNHDGITLALTQQAYANNYGTDGGVCYRASAIDAEGRAYLARWDTTDAWDAREAAYRADPENASPAEDESEACDWSAPVEIVSA